MWSLREKLSKIFDKTTPPSGEQTAIELEKAARDCTVAQFEATIKSQEGHYIHSSGMRTIFRGAHKAFMAGEPEKLQLALSTYAPAFTLAFDPYNPHAFYGNALLDIVNAGQDRVAGIMLALDKVEPAKKQIILNGALYYTISGNAPYVLVNALLKAGADPAHEDHRGLKNYLLAEAVVKRHPSAIVKLLVDHGAKFDEAFNVLQIWRKPQTVISQLQMLQEQLSIKATSKNKPA